MNEIITDYLRQALSGENPDRKAVVAAHPELGGALARRLQFVERVATRVLQERQDCDDDGKSTDAVVGASESTRSHVSLRATLGGGSPTSRRSRCRVRKVRRGPRRLGIRRRRTNIGRPGTRQDIQVDGRLPNAGHSVLSAAPSVASTGIGSAALIPGRKKNRLGRFQLDGVVGQGGFGLVLRGIDPALNREVAIKIPRPGRQPRRDARSSLEREARILASLNHPGIVRVYEFGCDRGLPFLVSELVSGKPLSQVLATRDLNFDESAEIVAQTAEALECAHRQGVVHRDIKPGNLLIDACGKVRLTDFGLAHFANQRAGDDGPALVGTHSFLSPEMVSGKPACDGRGDLFGLGVVLYRLLAGMFPFRGGPEFVGQQILHLQPVRPSEIQVTVPAQLDEICMRALEKRPRRRFGSAGEMAAELRAWLESQGDNRGAINDIRSNPPPFRYE